jgi:hypothetical protein
MAPGLRPGAVALGIEVRPRERQSSYTVSGSVIIGARARSTGYAQRCDYDQASI